MKKNSIQSNQINYPMVFEDVFTHYIWGGKNLPEYGKISSEGGFSESWELSAHQHGESIIANGTLKGIKFSELISQYPQEMLGDLAKSFDTFPLLIKLINTATAPSVQVHPDNENAKNLENYPYGKGEMWYILSHDGESECVCGVKSGVTKQQLKDNSNNIDQFLEKFPTKDHDYYNIPPGTVHAPGENIRFIEIQQNSDITYRLYDYNRKDANGNLRELHLDKGIQVTNLDFTHQPSVSTLVKKETNFLEENLVTEDYFVVNRIKLEGDMKVQMENQPIILIFIQGEASVTTLKGDIVLAKAVKTVYIPATVKDVEIEGNCTFLKCSIPN